MASNSALWRLDRSHLGQGPVLGVFLGVGSERI
jgi:hypothetical protein